MGLKMIYHRIKTSYYQNIFSKPLNSKKDKGKWRQNRIKALFKNAFLWYNIHVESTLIIDVNFNQY